MAKEIEQLRRYFDKHEELTVAALVEEIGMQRPTLHRLLFIPTREPRRPIRKLIRTFLKKKKAA